LRADYFFARHSPFRMIPALSRRRDDASEARRGPRKKPRLDKFAKSPYVFVIGLACRTLLLRKTARPRRSSPLKIDRKCAGPHVAARAKSMSD
jgi:hypothetical protein